VSWLRGAIAVALSIAAGLLCVVLAGGSAGDALHAVLVGAVGDRSALADTVNRATPLCIVGLGLSLAFRAGALNIGAEGQILGGACAAAAAGIHLHGLPALLAIPCVLGAAALGGALTAAAAAALRRWRGVPEVLSTILLNFVMVELTSWLVHGPLQERNASYPQSDPIAESAHLPRILPPTSMHAGALVALALVPLVWWFLFRTAAGLRLRAAGAGPAAARFAGFHPAAAAAWALVASGAFAGLAGGVQVSGLTGRLYADLSGGVGYMAIAVALLGRLHPAGIVVASLLFGVLDAGAAEMQRSAGVSGALAQVVQAVTLLGLLAADRLARRAPAGARA
jgi:simple sugar transport system permease protein